jgi:hypothetical protein
MRNIPYAKAILAILKNHCSDAIHLETIYKEMPQYKRLSEHDKEPWVDRFGRKLQQNFKHTIKSVLAQLVKKGKAEKRCEAWLLSKPRLLEKPFLLTFHIVFQ